MGVVIQGPRGSEVAKSVFGRSRDWLTKLERDGVIPPAPRDFSGYRVYPPEYVEQIKAIILGDSRKGPAST